MEASRILDRALVLMEFNKLDAAETALSQAIDTAKAEDDEETLITAMCCMGDYLFSLGRDEEAADWLKKVLARKSDNENLRDEFAMAEEFLKELGS